MSDGGSSRVRVITYTMLNNKSAAQSQFKVNQCGLAGRNNLGWVAGRSSLERWQVMMAWRRRGCEVRSTSLRDAGREGTRRRGSSDGKQQQDINITAWYYNILKCTSRQLHPGLQGRSCVCVTIVQPCCSARGDALCVYFKGHAWGRKRLRLSKPSAECWVLLECASLHADAKTRRTGVSCWGYWFTDGINTDWFISGVRNVNRRHAGTIAGEVVNNYFSKRVMARVKKT